MKKPFINTIKNVYTVEAAKQVLEKLTAYLKAADEFYEPQDMAGSPFHTLNIEVFDAQGSNTLGWDSYIIKQQHKLEALKEELEAFVAGWDS